MPDEQVTFGYPEFWATAYKAYQPAFDAVANELRLAPEMFNSSHVKLKNQLHVAVYMLVSMTATGLHELMILAGNGAGVGVMKISRGMFESAVMAEYLRTHPEEIDDYAEYRHILAWKRLQQAGDLFTVEHAQRIEREYQRAKPRFEDKNGKIRSQWNRHSIYKMASALGREEQYELAYSIAASMHHGNVEATMAHMEGNEHKMTIISLTRLRWLGLSRHS
jgi:hypothetical protein